MPSLEEKAAQLLIHYFRQVYRQAGLQWGSENDREIEEIIRLIIQACVNSREE